MSEALPPGLELLVEITKSDERSDWLIREVDDLARRSGEYGVKSETLIAVLASCLGYAVGHGVRQGGAPILVVADPLERPLLMVEAIIEDCARDAARRA